MASVACVASVVMNTRPDASGALPVAEARLLQIAEETQVGLVA